MTGQPTTAPVPAPNWCHPATVLRVIDGDTLVARLDLGRYGGGDIVEHTTIIRIAGLYAPELHQDGGPQARLALMQLTAIDVPRPAVVIQTRKPNPRDPYGRVVADVWLADGTRVADAMIAAGHGSATPH